MSYALSLKSLHINASHQISQISLSSSYQLDCKSKDFNLTWTKYLLSSEIEPFHPEDPAQVFSTWCYNLNHSSNHYPSSAQQPASITTIAVQFYISISTSENPEYSILDMGLTPIRIRGKRKAPSGNKLIFHFHLRQLFFAKAITKKTTPKTKNPL